MSLPVRIGFDTVGLLSGFAPQFHHIFSKAFVGEAHPANLINALANIALIGPAIDDLLNPSDSLCRHTQRRVFLVVPLCRRLGVACPSIRFPSDS